MACVLDETSRNKTCAWPRILEVFMATMSRMDPYTEKSMYRARFKSSFWSLSGKLEQYRVWLGRTPFAGAALEAICKDTTGRLEKLMRIE